MMAPAFGAALFAIAGTTLTDPQPVAAATAIMLDRDRAAVGYCAGATDPFEAMTCAQRRCESRGGRNCEVIEGCPRAGHGAIAIDKAARSVGSSCGKASSAEARAQAMQRCAVKGANCKIVEVFSDAPKTAQAAPAEQAPKAAQTKQSAAKQAAQPPAAKPAAPARQAAPAPQSAPAPKAAPAPQTPQKQAAAPAPKPQPVTRVEQPASKPAAEPAKPAQTQAAKRSAADVAATAPAAGTGAATAQPKPMEKKIETAQAAAPAAGAAAAPGSGQASAPAGQTSAVTAPDAAAERKQRMKELLDALRRRANARNPAEPLSSSQQQMADQLVGVWSSQNCAQKFWRITKANEKRFDVFVWYEDGHEDRTHFTVSFDEELMILSWANRLPNAIEGLKRGRRYIEAVGKVEENAYTVVQNNYRDFDRAWTVRRCTAKR